jgi:hypothetical protein
MVQIIKPGTTKVITKDGECEITISIELNINLNQSGITVSAQSVQAEAKEIKQEVKEPESTNWAIPDFSNLKKVQFGKGS